MAVRTLQHVGSTLTRNINGQDKVVALYNTNSCNISDIFDLESDELQYFIKKKSTAPVGYLRTFYQTQSNRGLISKIVRQALRLILWEVIQGKTFYLPNSTSTKIFVGAMPKKFARITRKRGNYKGMKLYMSDFAIPQIQMYLSGSSAQYNPVIFANKDFIYEMHRLLNDNGKVGGKIPLRITYVLKRLYDDFSYVERRCIKLIIYTFFRRMLIVAKSGGDLIVKDNDYFIKFYYPKTINQYNRTSAGTKRRALKNLAKDKLKYQDTWKRSQTPSQN